MLFVEFYNSNILWNLRFFVFWILLFFDKPWIAKGVVEPRVERILLNIATQPFAPIENVSEKCLKDSEIYFQDLYDYKPWALKMYDASSKIPSGLLTGNNEQLGNYEECLRIRTEYGFAGQACNTNIQITTPKEEDNSTNLTNLLIQVSRITVTKKSKSSSKNLTYDWMWCVPATCSSSEILQALDQRLNPLRIKSIKDGVNVNVKVNQVTCHSEDNNRVTFNIDDWIYTGIILVFLTLIVASTTYDFIKRRGSGTFDHKDFKHVTMLSSFSIYTNGKSLFSTERSGSAIGCLDGIRFFSICWIIFSHTYSIEIDDVILDVFNVPRIYDTLSNLFFLNSNIATDIFFLMSATLLAYTLLMKNEKSSDGDSLNLLQLYVHRYFRLTPPYAMIIGFYATLFYKLGSGPKWDISVRKESEFCRKNWWTNLLYINNFIDLDNMCMAQSWYLSVDMQLLWISPIFLYPMLKLKRKIFFWIILTMSFIVSVIVPFTITYCENLPGTLLFYREFDEAQKIYHMIYVKTYSRAGPYIMGLGLGYLLFKTRSYKITIPWPYVLSGWILAIIVGFTVVLAPQIFFYSYDKIEASFYAGLHRHAFALVFSWIIFATTHGYGGPIGEFLSWRFWIPFSRLTYCAYLSHFIVLLYYSGRVMTSKNLSTIDVLRTYFGNLILSLVISLIVCLCFEMPFLTLDRVLKFKKPNVGAKTADRE